MTASGIPTRNIPVPDPSDVTVREIEKAKEELRRDYVERIASASAILAIRQDDSDKASVVLAENVNRVPTLLDREVARIFDILKRSEELAHEKFAGIGRQIQDRDLRAEQDKKSAETAITAAFQAQKEAAGKSEFLTTKMIDGLGAVLATNTKTTDDKITIINERLNKAEGADKGSAASMSMTIAVAALVATVAGVGVAYLNHAAGGAQLSIAPPATIQAPAR